MKRFKYLFLIFSLTAILTGCNEKNVENTTILSAEQFKSTMQYLHKNYKSEKYKILQVLPGNFLSSGKESYLIFLDKKQKSSKDIERLFIADFSGDSSIAAVYGLDYARDIFYADGLLPEVKDFGLQFNQGWICDVNGNGLDEIFIYHGHGSYENILGYEFNGTEIKTVLPYYEGEANVQRVDRKNKSIYIRRILQLELPDYSDIDARDTFIMWNEKTNVYEEHLCSNLSYDVEKQDYVKIE